MKEGRTILLAFVILAVLQIESFFVDSSPARHHGCKKSKGRSHPKFMKLEDHRAHKGSFVPNPYDNSAPNPYDNSVPNPYHNSFPNPYDNSFPNPYDNSVPNPYDNSALKPYDKGAPNPGLGLPNIVDVNVLGVHVGVG